MPTIWRALGGDPALLERVQADGAAEILPSVYDVTGLATSMVAVAALAAAELLATRVGTPVAGVNVDRRHACAAFISERLFAPEGWERPALWDPVAGDYRSGDGWIRLHTNYEHHLDAALHVLGCEPEREAVAAAVAGWNARELQDVIVAEGGCAAAMNTRDEWIGSEPGAATENEPLVRVRQRSAVDPEASETRPIAGPLAGVRVLDLTRVIAGPVCTRFLAAYGADVLRLDPPGFAEVAAAIPETSAGKHCARLNVTMPASRAVFERRLSQADVLVTGLRPGALDALGYDADALRDLNPNLVTASLDAYGWAGPWAGRRGFDSLVQMSCGIAAAGAEAAESDAPVPLPAQALDHGTGYLLAAAICRALTERVRLNRVSDVRCSLIATANLLISHPSTSGLSAPAPQWSEADTEPVATEWGPARRVPVPGRIEGVLSRLPVEPGPLGRHAARWSQAM